MKIFKNIKHWQLFMVMIGPPVIVAAFAGPGPNELRSLASIVGYSVYFIWLWSIGILYRASYSEDIIYSVFILTGGVAIIGVEIYDLYNKQSEDLEPSLWGNIGFFFVWVIGIFLTARRLKLVESAQGRPGSNIVLDCFAFFIIPIGPWIIQPRVNRLECRKS